MEFIQTLITTIATGILAVNFSQFIWVASMLSICIFLWRVQKNGKLDMTDMLTKNGNSVSLTKVLQLVGGITATWVIMHLTMNSTLTESIFGLYLVYIGGVEGYSKFVAAKYNYDEKSVRGTASEKPEGE